MEKWEIRPPLPQKPLNRSSPKFAWVITSGTPTPMQNFIMIWLPSFAPQICENVHKVTLLVFLVLPSAYSQDPRTNFHDQYVKWRRFPQERAFWGSQKQNFTFRPRYPPKCKFLAKFWLFTIITKWWLTFHFSLLSVLYYCWLTLFPSVKYHLLYCERNVSNG